MNCYKCGAALSENDFCTNCGADVLLYKKVIRSSEAYYNQGLALAQARDLSGSAEALRRSVKLYKHNTKARNLLGLVYFETGEAVAALSQWVISKNLQPEKNIADKYLAAIQKNGGRLETINQTIKKYNQALLYAKQDSADLAIIQLKKVLTLNPNLVKGHQLLSLLYMKTNDYEKALPPLKKALTIDKSNPLTLKYMKEIRSVLDASDKKRENTRHQKQKINTSGDEPILQPVNYREANSGGLTVLNVVIGIIIGAALVMFLVFPSKEKTLAEEYNRKLGEISEQMEARSTTIAALEEEQKVWLSEKEALETELARYMGKDGVINQYKNLILALEAYLAADHVAAMNALSGIDAASMEDENVTALYERIRTESGAEAARALYTEGYAAYQNRNYAEAAEILQRAYDYNSEDAATVYYLGRAYQRSDDTENGKKYLQEVIDKFPNSSYYGEAVNYITN